MHRYYSFSHGLRIKSSWLHSETTNHRWHRLYARSSNENVRYNNFHSTATHKNLIHSFLLQPLLQTCCNYYYNSTTFHRLADATYHRHDRYDVVVRWNSTATTILPPSRTTATGTSSVSVSHTESNTSMNQLSQSIPTTTTLVSPLVVNAASSDESSSSSTTTPSSSSSSSSTEKISSTTGEAGDTEADHHTGNTNSSTMREKIRDRIQESRTAAVAQIKEFRDHPGQSAKEGAKTFSGMLRKYGPVFVGTYGCVYFTTLGLLFSGVQTGALDPLSLFGYLGSHNPSEHGAETATTVHLVVDWMVNHDFTKPYAPYIEKNPAFANFAVAWIAVKFTEPVRLPIALALTPRVSRFLGYTTTETPTSEPSTNETTTKEDATKK